MKNIDPKTVEGFGREWSSFDQSGLSDEDKSFYVMRTDALDPFGTRLEKRFSKVEIKSMLENSGFINIHFSDKQPYWCAVGTRDKACAE
jgi:hypothetical protein